MKRFLVALLLFAINATLSAQNHGDSVIYKRDFRKLTFYADGTYKYVRYPCDICPQLTPGDVESFGTYYKVDKSYYLFSDKSLKSSYSNLYARESVLDNDSITFHFQLPRPNEKTDYGNWLFFQVTLFLKPENQDWYFSTRWKNTKVYYTDDVTLTIPKPDQEIENYTVNVFSANCEASIPQLSLDYKIDNPDANVFDISLPMATPEFFIYTRYYGEPVTILDDDAVLFGDHVLLRWGAFDDIFYSPYSGVPKKYHKYVLGSVEAFHKHGQENKIGYPLEWEKDISICGFRYSANALFDAVLPYSPNNFWDEKQYEDAGFDCDSCQRAFIDTLCQRYIQLPANAFYLFILDKICQQADGWMGEYMIWETVKIFHAVPQYFCQYLFDNRNNDDENGNHRWGIDDYLLWWLSSCAAQEPSVKSFQNALRESIKIAVTDKEVQEYISKAIIDKIE